MEKRLNKYIDKLGEFKGTSQFINANGNPQANHFELRYTNGIVFQSYDSIIAVEIFNNHDGTQENITYLGADYKYSTTTSKHLNYFLGVDSKGRDKRIKQGVYVVDYNLR